jgi:FMN phosphatase YigB (HAD superfamily)
MTKSTSGMYKATALLRGKRHWAHRNLPLIPSLWHDAAHDRLLDQGSPRDVVVVGDTHYDIEAAAKAGMRTIGMLCGGFPEDVLRGAGAIAIYRDPAHLLADYDTSPLASLV